MHIHSKHTAGFWFAIMVMAAIAFAFKEFNGLEDEEIAQCFNEIKGAK